MAMKPPSVNAVSQVCTEYMMTVDMMKLAACCVLKKFTINFQPTTAFCQVLKPFDCPVAQSEFTPMTDLNGLLSLYAILTHPENIFRESDRR